MGVMFEIMEMAGKLHMHNLTKNAKTHTKNLLVGT